MGAASRADTATGGGSAKDPPDRGKEITIATNSDIVEAPGSDIVEDPAIVFSGEENPVVQVQVYKINTGRYVVDLMLNGQILAGTIALQNLAALLMNSSVLGAALITEQLDSSSKSRKHRTQAT